MLTPHRFMNLEYCLIYVSSLVIECLVSRGDTSLSELYRYCKVLNEEINEQDITDAISLLYLLGKAKYSVDNDLVGILGN